MLLVRVKQELLPLMRALAQDVDHQVRVTMCQQLCNLTRDLGYALSLFLSLIGFLLVLLLLLLFQGRSSVRSGGAVN